MKCEHLCGLILTTKKVYFLHDLCWPFTSACSLVIFKVSVFLNFDLIAYRTSVLMEIWATTVGPRPDDKGNPESAIERRADFLFSFSQSGSLNDFFGGSTFLRIHFSEDPLFWGSTFLRIHFFEVPLFLRIHFFEDPLFWGSTFLRIHFFSGKIEMLEKKFPARFKNSQQVHGSRVYYSQHVSREY